MSVTAPASGWRLISQLQGAPNTWLPTWLHVDGSSGLATPKDGESASYQHPPSLAEKNCITFSRETPVQDLASNLRVHLSKFNAPEYVPLSDHVPVSSQDNAVFESLHTLCETVVS